MHSRNVKIGKLPIKVFFTTVRFQEMLKKTVLID